MAASNFKIALFLFVILVGIFQVEGLNIDKSTNQKRTKLFSAVPVDQEKIPVVGSPTENRASNYSDVEVYDYGDYTSGFSDELWEELGKQESGELEKQESEELEKQQSEEAKGWFEAQKLDDSIEEDGENDDDYDSWW